MSGNDTMTLKFHGFTLAALPTIIAWMAANAAFLDQGALIGLFSFAITAGSVVFGLLWVVINQIVQSSPEGLERPRSLGMRLLCETVKVALSIAWVAVVFDQALIHATGEYQVGGLLAGYATVTAWWVLQLSPWGNQRSADPYAVAFLVATAATTILLWLSLPIASSLLPGGCVLLAVACHRALKARAQD